MSGTPTPLRRRYAGEAELGLLLEFASRSLVERGPLGATWHPGDVVWELRGQYGSPQPIGFWEHGGVVQALAWFVGPGQLWLETLPSAESLVPEVIGWAEESMLRDPGAQPAPRLSVRVPHKDLRRIARLEALGYERAEPEAVQFEFDLADDLPEADVPKGFIVRDCVDVDLELRAAAHRDAWNDLSRIGVENASSTFSAAMYQSVRARPSYRPELDLVVEAPDGRLVATCICWADEPSGVGIFEPMGTHPDFRGRRLARALLLEGLRRLRSTRHRRARIGTAHFNAPAIAAYSALFRPLDRTSWWAKVL